MTFDECISTILDVYFMQGGNIDCCNQLVKHQIDSYNDFLCNKLDKIVRGYNPIKIVSDYNTTRNDYNQKLFLYIEEPHFTKPMYKKQDGTEITMTPNMARLDNLTYATDLYVNVRISMEIYNVDEHTVETKNKKLHDIFIGKMPVMVGSKACILTVIPDELLNSECKYDTGGYFIVNGNEKVLINQDRIKENYVLIFKPANNSDHIHAEIRSTNTISYLPAKTISLSMSTKSNHMGRVIRLNTSFLKSEIPVFVMFRALGVETDYDIIHHIVYDTSKPNMKNIIEELRACCEDAAGIYTKSDAMDVLLRNITGNIKNTKTLYIVESMLNNDFIPHVSTQKRKALYLGHMIYKILSIYLGYERYDNRDSYINKRIDTPGILLSSLFRQCFGKIVKDLKTNIESEILRWRANNSNVADIVSEKQHISKYFKQSSLESSLRYALSTGNWGIKSQGNFQNIKPGVSQVLNRMSYHSTLSHLRRINTAMEKNGKLVQPRKLDNSQFGMICPAECFHPDTPILMWDGTIKKAKDIVVDDYLIDDKGNSVRVKSTCSGKKAMYEVIPDKKNFMKHTVTDNHILTLKVKQHKYARKNKNKINFMWFDKEELRFRSKTFDNIEECDKFADTIHDDDIIDITIEKYLSLPKTVKKLLYIFKSDGINWDTKDVALDPYILGMWLGDGLSRGYGFITADKELLDVWIKWGEDNDATITKNKDKYRYTLSSTINKTQSGINCNKTEKAPLKKLLDKYNLVNNKHIPLDYLTNDRKTRLAVLAGLIDTDGNVRANGHEIRISQGESNYRIIYDTEFLARSLGFSCHMRDGICTYSVKGEKRKKPYKELTITGKYLYEIPTVLPRKKLNKCNSPTHEKKCDGYLMTLFQLVKKEVQPYVGWQLDGNGRFLLSDMSTLHNTPEGAPVGLVKNMAMSSNISIYGSSYFIKLLLIDNGVIEFSDDVKDTVEYLINMGRNVRVMLNGEIFGYHTKPRELYTMLQSFKRQSYINPVTSVSWDITNQIINISTEGGRMYRPLLIVDEDGTLRYDKFVEKYGLEELSTWTFEAFMSPYFHGKDEMEGFVEYLDIDEISQAVIAMYPDDLKKDPVGFTLRPNYTHCEIHPSLINGVPASNIAFSNHNQAPRNTYQCAMAKQALGIYMSTFPTRMDTISNVLNYPQKALISTKLSKYTRTAELPAGINAIVAIMTYSGFNQEDGIMVNKNALDRGLFTSTHYKCIKDQCSKNGSTGEEEVFCRPKKDDISKPFNYDKIADDGFVPVNTLVEGGDVIIGKIMPRKLKGKIHNIDSSVSMKPNERGYIDMNYREVNNDGYSFCKVRIRNYRKPVVGDKLACYTPDHEYLTETGWVKVNELTSNHKVATLVNGNTLVYQKPTQIHKYVYASDMIEFTTNHISLCVTPNHSMYVYTSDNDDYKLIRADKLYDEQLDSIHLRTTEFTNMTNNQIYCFPKLYDNNNVLHQELHININVWLKIYILYKLYGRESTHKNCIEINMYHVYSLNFLDVIKEHGFKYTYIDYILKIESIHLYNYFLHEPSNLLGEWIFKINMFTIYNVIQFIFTVCQGTLYLDSKQLADEIMRLAILGGESCNIENTNRKFEITLNDIPTINVEKNNMRKKYYVGEVFCCTVPSGILYVRRHGRGLWCGNSSIAQKASIGMIYNQEDMPYNKDGIVPDLIMNPHAIPSRMTIAQLMECVLGKVACLKGELQDSTPFNHTSVHDLCDMLESYGMDRYSNEILYDGRTGRMIRTEIFMGPTYYQRLKHMVADKIHCLRDFCEVLTKTGWKQICDITMLDEIAVLNKDGINFEYEHPTDIIHYDNYEGLMYKIKNKYVELDTTMEHKMYVRRYDSTCNDWKSFSLDTANDILESGEMVRYKKNGCIITDSTNLDNMKQYIDSIICDNNDNYYTCNKMDADYLMRMCIHVGWSAIISSLENKYCVTVLKSDIHNMPFVHPDDTSVYNYKGSVYCLTVSTGVFMVRQNGKNMWTGNSRGSSGPIVMLTRQPSEGRSRCGGLRMGEMERDCIVSHGSSLFLKERLLECSDNSKQCICKNCGIIAVTNSESKIYKCNICRNDTDIAQVRIPYSFKLLMQELQCMNIGVRMII